MLNISKQLEYIYSIQILEIKIKESKRIFKFLPILYKKKVKKIDKYRKNIKINKINLLELKKNKIELDNKLNFYLDLLKKYERQRLDINEINQFNIINKEFEYSKLKIRLYKSLIDTNKKKIKKNKISTNSFFKKIGETKKKIKIKKNIYKSILKTLKNNIKKIYSILNFYRKKIKKYKIYKKYSLIKKNSIDNLGIVHIYRANVISNTNLTIPKALVYKINKNNNIYYDYYTGKIIISNKLSRKIEKKINSKINKIKNIII